MTDERIRAYANEVLMPVHDALVNNMCALFRPINDSLASFPKEFVEKQLNEMIKYQADALTASIKAVDMSKIAEGLKEKFNEQTK